MSLQGIFIRIFVSLLKLYPKQFRTEFAEEMKTVFAAQMKNQAEEGWFQLVTAGLIEFFDLWKNLFFAYWDIFKKEFGMDTFLHARFHNHLIGWGSIVFGLAYGLEALIESLTGLTTTGFSKMTSFTVLVVFLTQMIFIGVATGLFWLGTPRWKSKWSFLPSVIAASLFNLLNLVFSFTVLWHPQISNQPASAITYLLPWPEVFTILWSLIFGGLFGWAYRGWKAVFPFAIVTVMSKFLRFIIGWVMAVLLNLNIDPTANILLRPGPFLWSLAYVILGGMIFGALLGWAANQVNRRGGPDVAAT